MYVLPLSSLYEKIDITMVRLDTILKIKFPFKDAQFRQKEREGFRSGKSPLSGCIGGVDGLEIKIREPSAMDVPNTSV